MSLLERINSWVIYHFRRAMTGLPLLCQFLFFLTYIHSSPVHCDNVSHDWRPHLASDFAPNGSITEGHPPQTLADYSSLISRTAVSSPHYRRQLAPPPPHKSRIWSNTPPIHRAGGGHPRLPSSRPRLSPRRYLGIYVQAFLEPHRHSCFLSQQSPLFPP